MLHILLFFACSSSIKITGNVTDIWNKPIGDVSIKMEGLEEAQISDANGDFVFTLPKETDGTLRFRADHEKYIYDVESIVYSKDLPKEDPVSVHFALYPKPPEKGFFGVGESDYIHIQGQKLTQFNAPLEKISGLVRIGKARLNTVSPQFVYHSSLRKEEIKQIDLGVYELHFKEHEEMTTLLGVQDIEVDLWIAKNKPIPFNIKTLDQEEMYVLEFPQPLEKGIYAFSGEYLEKDTDITLPKELQLAYPFEIK